jgi:S-methylmethionine-dependent homocysteine/selenocysteine methylase
MKRLKKDFLQLPSRFFSTGYFITDGNLEATLKGQNVELIHDAAFELLYTREGRQLLKDYHRPFIDLAAQFNQTYIIQTPTLRANPDWIFRLGYPLAEIRVITRHATQFVREIQYAENSDNILISGCIGPRKTNTHLSGAMSADEAAKYHSEQVLTFALSDVDFISGMSMNDISEAIGIIQAAKTVGVPVVISFLVGTDGCLQSGEELTHAVSMVDKATGNYAQHFMIQCEDPISLQSLILHDAVPKSRVRGISVNMTGVRQRTKSNQTIQRGKTLQVTSDLLTIRRALPDLKVFGGCCDGKNEILDEVCRQMFLLQ